MLHLYFSYTFHCQFTDPKGGGACGAKSPHQSWVTWAYWKVLRGLVRQRQLGGAQQQVFEDHEVAYLALRWQADSQVISVGDSI